MPAGKRVLLIVGGGVAAYKALELVRLLKKADIAVRPILTRAGAEFVTPLSLQALAEDKVYQDLFSLTGESEMGHIELSRSADLIVVAPATADLMAKAAHGLCDDLASTTLLAADTPVLMAPAMNVRMWEHPATRANLETLKSRGVAFVGPGEGAMACGEFGFGRLAEPQEIFAAITGALSGEGGGALPLKDKRFLITAGPTVEPIDPVRVLTNRSSGKQGYAVAGALAALGAEVTLVSGPTSLPAPKGVKRVAVQTARQMLEACEAALPVDGAVFVAAVADWRPAEAAGAKARKAARGLSLALAENPDILETIARPGPMRPGLVVGFAAETTGDDAELESLARAKRLRKGCDWIVANDVSRDGLMGGDQNAVLFVTAEGTEHWGITSKAEIARELAARIEAALA
jgi:phosphopantothenoylcysteine decarboxylase/phosphopantothenate--cysteine ligase